MCVCVIDMGEEVVRATISLLDLTNSIYLNGWYGII